MVLTVTIGRLGYPDQANAQSGKQTFEMTAGRITLGMILIGLLRVFIKL